MLLMLRHAMQATAPRGVLGLLSPDVLGAGSLACKEGPQSSEASDVNFGSIAKLGLRSWLTRMPGAGACHMVLRCHHCDGQASACRRLGTVAVDALRMVLGQLTKASPWHDAIGINTRLSGMCSTQWLQ